MQWLHGSKDMIAMFGFVFIKSVWVLQYTSIFIVFLFLFLGQYIL